MWIFLPESFVSIVRKPDQVPGFLTVRARVAGDINRLFPGAEVSTDGGTDYQFRANVPATEVAAVVADRITGIPYANFKAAVTEADRESVYARVWRRMRDFGLMRQQEGLPVDA